MGLHSARRTRGGLSSVAGRGLLISSTAFALIGGGTGMAFAGEAPADDSGSHKVSDDHGKDGWGHGEHDGKGKHDGKYKHEKCEIPIYDPADEDLTKFLDSETHGEYSKLGEPIKPTEDEVHDAICPPAKELLGGEEKPEPTKESEPTTMLEH